MRFLTLSNVFRIKSQSYLANASILSWAQLKFGPPQLSSLPSVFALPFLSALLTRSLSYSDLTTSEKPPQSPHLQ